MGVFQGISLYINMSQVLPNHQYHTFLWALFSRSNTIAINTRWNTPQALSRPFPWHLGCP